MKLERGPSDPQRLKHRRELRCLCGHVGREHGVLACRLCDCEEFRLSPCQPKGSPPVMTGR
jgi:hypothetical protein